MTRDEAIDLAWRDTTNPKLVAEGIVDALARLGVLKLDEPKEQSQSDRIDGAIKSMGWTRPGAASVSFCGANIEQAIRQAGLKIVEAEA